MSNRLTFSLASLIFLITLGLVFAPMSVMAHGPNTIGNLRSHTHPVNTAIPGNDLNADGDTNDIGEGAVSTHNAHPIPTLSLKPDAANATTAKVRDNKVVIASAASQTNAIDANEFVLVVDFDQDVVNLNSIEEVDRDTETLPTLTFLSATLNANGASITNGVSLGTPTRFGTATDKNEDDSKFEILVTVNSTAIPTGSAALETVTVRFQLRQTHDDNDNNTTESDVYSLATMPLFTQVPGGASEASNFFEITLVKEFPKASDTTAPTVTITEPTKQETNGDLVFTFAFSKELGNASNDLQAGDIDVTGGTVASVVEDTTDAKKYAVTVTPTNTTTPQVAISLRAESVADTAGNFIDLTGTNNGKAAYDQIHPTVLSHESVVATVTPTGGSDTETYLNFTFTFSEPIDKGTIKVSAIDQGASHNAGFNLSYFFDATDTSGDATNMYTITVRVLDPKKATTIALKIGEDRDAGVVTDMAGNGLAESYTATHSATDNTAPVFVTDTIPPDDDQALNWCEDQTREPVVLPQAKDTEGDALTYSLSANAKGHVIPANPSPVPTSGLYWITIDSETRHLLGKAETDDDGTYTWTATDANGMKTVIPKTITIVVREHQEPGAPEGLRAQKVKSESEQPPTQDRVELTWDVPKDKTGWPHCIPAVESYTVEIEMWDEAIKDWVAGNPATVSVDVDDLLTDPKGTTANPRHRLALDQLATGIYQFRIQAHNIADDSPSDWSAYATWEKTLGKRVVVADVPAAPIDLRAAVADGVYATVNWTKVPNHGEAAYPYNNDEDDGGAPIYDDKIDDATPKKNREMYYGPGVNGDFGGYVLYQLNQTTNVETRYVLNVGPGHLGPAAIDKDAPPIGNYDHPSTRVGPLGAGEYIFRVTAVNVAGQSPRSLSTPFAHIKVVTTTTTPPGGLPSTVSATHDPATGITTLTGTLASNGFAVISASALPNIFRFFAEGGSISVLGPTGSEAKSVVISEIMWGLNERQPVGAGRDAEQFIELYNTKSTAVPLSSVTIVFDGSNTVPAVPTGKVLLDQVSNVAGTGWVIGDAPGQSGLIRLAADPSTVASKNLISMYRTINYATVEKTDHDADAKKNREAQLKGVPDGNVIKSKTADDDSWDSSDTTDTYGVNRIGSPGRQHFQPYKPVTKSEVDRSQIIVNEIGNHSDDSYDWVELRNVSDAEVNLKKWKLSQVTSDKKDTALVTFPDNDNHKIPAGEVLLLVNSDPYRDNSHPIAAGVRINGTAEKTGTKARYYVDGNLKLADTGDTLLILRNTDGKFRDAAGTLSIADSSANFKTSMWPLVATGAAHGNVIDNDKDNKEDDFRSGRVYTRLNAGGDSGTGEKHWSIASYTGVGYKRSAANNGQNAGTPGYASADVKVNVSELASDATVTISEIMYAKGRNLPQWIELYNSSMTQPVNISEWKLRIDNLRSDEDIDIRSPSVTTNNFGGGVIIQPNQTVLIVSGKTRRDSRSAPGGVDFPDSRIVDLWGQKDRIEVDSDKNSLTYQLLSETAFTLTLLDKGGAIVETVGNLDTDRETVLWDLPSVEAMDEGRSSIIRSYPKNERPKVGTDGMMENAWMLASDTNLAEVRFNDTYYGNSTDIGTPGYRGGGPLPVSLSKFRPERLEDGSIVVRWITESELNNAGFNILRSEKRDGEFKQINTKLIKGQGTTSERTDYTWKDSTAKPNVVYYYQIQDVSLDGEVQTLRQSRLKGNVTAAGKLTTTWGELKALQ